MGQNLSHSVVNQQKEVSLSKTVKIKIPFSQLPNKAVFNYIMPVNYHDEVVQNAVSEKCLPCNSEEQGEDDEFLTEITRLKSMKEIKVKWNSFVKMKEKNYLQDYEIIKNVFGKGGFGVVRKVKSKFTSQVRVAKVVKKKLMKQDDVTKLFTELYIMKMLDHPNIIKLYEVYDFEEEFILIIEMCSGGEVFQKSKKKKIPQKKAASIIKQVLRALIYMHNRKIVHRDIKPENIMFQNESHNAVKLIDFGIAKKMQSDAFLIDRIGTPSYISPQIIYKKYNEKCDIWATGVSFYQLISGRLPFVGSDDPEILRQILRSEISFKGSVWQKVSPECKQVIKLMLTKKFQDRPSAKEVFELDYFAQIQQNQNEICVLQQRNSVIDNIHDFKFKNKLQAVVQTFIASQLLTQQEKKTLVEVFRQFDTNNDGVISSQELRIALESRGNMTESKILQMMRVIDINGSGEIDYTEFLVANCDSTTQLTRQRLKQVFQYFDTDHNGTITYSEVAEFLQDYESSQQQIRNIFKSVDANGDGSISEDEFIELLIKKVQSFTNLNQIDQIDTEKMSRRKEIKDRANNFQERQKARKITLVGMNGLLNSKKETFQSLILKK